MIAETPRVSGRPEIGEHYTTLEQQRSAAELGMWIFLATELMLFGGLFTAYTVYRIVYPVEFAEASRHLDLLYGGVNTAVLLISSLTMTFAVRAASAGGRRGLVGWLATTGVLGLVFLAIKALEYQKHFAEGMVPGVVWTYDGPLSSQLQLFFFAYFAMTGLHTVHLGAGIVLVGVMAIVVARGAMGAQHGTSVELLGLYWHFVDVIWIFLVSLLYLADWGLLAVLIAALLATVIAAFLMQLRQSSSLNRLVALGALAWLGILIGGTLDDILTRGWLQS